MSDSPTPIEQGAPRIEKPATPKPAEPPKEAQPLGAAEQQIVARIDKDGDEDKVLKDIAGAQPQAGGETPKIPFQQFLDEESANDRTPIVGGEIVSPTAVRVDDPRNPEGNVDEGDIGRINDYLELKLPLYSTYKQYFDRFPSLKPILSTFMLVNSQYKDKARLRQVIKGQLIGAGIDHVEVSEELFQFLLLISEKVRTFDDQPQNVSHEELGKYYFEKYRSPSEKWSSREFQFSLEHNHSYQMEEDKVIEEVAIRMIAHSRSDLEKAIEPPREVKKFIGKLNDYYQRAFTSVFESAPNLSLAEVTCVTKDYQSHGDLVGGKTFVNIGEFYENRDHFAHLVIHEATHLSFEGFHERLLEEGLIEYFIEKMFKKYPSRDFSYSPVSYKDWRDDFKSLFGALPDSEEHFVQYFLTGDLKQLADYLETNFTAGVADRIKEERFSGSLREFFDSINKLKGSNRP